MIFFKLFKKILLYLINLIFKAFSTYVQENYTRPSIGFAISKHLDYPSNEQFR